MVITVFLKQISLRLDALPDANEQLSLLPLFTVTPIYKRVLLKITKNCHQFND